ncbi:hypothetical protein [Nocardia testacea]|uniref:hypothetical protein n=1 Tax=Nocardia testacea TaxID=248551 RepID=UPI003A8ACC9E
MNKIQLEIRVNEIVGDVVAGGKIEDDWTEAKGAWPERKSACQLAGMANASGGHPILWIVGLSENGHKVLELNDDVDPNTWWMQMRAEFAHDVAPDLTVLRVVTDHGPVFALQFETEQAPYIVKIPKTGWTTSAVPWREGTGTRTATRAELLSILAPSTVVPKLDLVQSEATLYEAPRQKGLPMALLIVKGRTLIDAFPGQHILFPKHRHTVTVVTPTGERFDVRGASIKFSTAADDRQVDRSSVLFAAPRLKAINPYGASEQPAGLVVLAPDVVNWRIDLAMLLDSATPLRDAGWVDVTLSLPISSTQQAAVLRFRLTRDEDASTETPNGMEHVLSWNSFPGP